MKMTRRVLALLLALCLTFGNVMPAMATGLEGEEPAVTEEITPVVPEVEETEAPAEAEETKAPVAEVTEAPVVETEAPVVETEAPVEETEAIVEETIGQIIDEATFEVDQNGLLAEFTFGTGTSTTWTDGNSFTSKTYTSGNYTLNFTNGVKVYSGGWDTNSKGFIKFGTSSAAGSLSFTVPDDVTSVVLHIAGYKANNAKYTINAGVTETLTEQANSNTYREVTIDTSETKTVTIATVSGGYRMVMYTVAYYGGGEVCEHQWDDGVVTPATCFEDGYTTYTCGLCGDTKTDNVVKAAHTNDESGVCTVCGDGTVLTIAEAITKGGSTGNSLYTQEKYRVSGEISEVQNTTYGNVVITDGTNSILIYGLYSADGSVRYDKMETQPVVGDTITVYGIIGNYNGTPQMKNGWLLVHTPAGSDPEPSEPEVTEPTPSEPTGGEETLAATLSLANQTYRTSYATDKVVYENGGITFTNTKENSSNDMRDNADDNHIRLYANSNVKIEYPGMTKIVFTCPNATQVDYAETDLAQIGTVTADATNLTVTVVLASAADSVSYDVSTQHRFTQIEVYIAGGSTEPSTPSDPEADTELTIAEAIALGASKEHNTYTDGKYYVTGEITEVYNTQYGNMKIKDAQGNILTVYGTYSADGEIRYDAMDVKPVAGDTIKVYGIIGQYNGTPQLKNGWIVEHTPAAGVDPDPSEPENNDPAADSVLTIAEAIALGSSKEHNTYTAGKYYVTGEITEVYQTTYGNMKIKDEAGNILTVYGTYSADGEIRYDAMDVKPVAGDTIKVYGIIGQYNGTPQIKNGWIVEHTPAEPEVINVAFDLSGTNWSSVDAYLRDAADSSYRIDLVKTESGVCYFGVDEYFPLSPAEIVSIGFCEHAGGGYTNIVAYENGKTYSAADFTITDESITVYWDNSVTPLNDVILVLSCAHGGETGPIETHFGEWGFVKSVNGDIYEFEIPACTAGHTIWFDNEAFTAEDGMTYPQCIGRPGTEKNPEAVIFAWNENGSSATASVTIPAASTYYISFATGRGFMAPTMELYADDVYVGSYSGTDFAPAVVGLTNESEEAVTVALRLSHPVGSQMNPDTLWSLGINYTSVEAGDSDGYYYTYTIEQDGTLNITTVDNGIVTDVVVEKVVNDIPVSKSLLMDGVDGVLTYDVAAGDVLTIQVVAVQDAAGNYYPAAEIEWNINYPAGSALNPIAIQPSMGFGEIESSTAVTIPAHTTYYVAVSTGVRGGEMLLTIDDEEYGIINAPNWQPLVLELVNDSDEEITKILTLAFPAGSQMNPANLYVYTEGESWEEYEGNNVATVSEGSWSGYLYTWYAPKAGELTVSFNNGKAGWAYTVNNMTSWIYGDSHASYDEPNVNTETIIVNAGDEIQIIVNSAGESYMDVTPAGDIHFYAYFNPYVGIESNPFELDWNEAWQWNEEYTEATATITVPAGETYYVRTWLGKWIMTINDGEAFELVDEEQDGIVIPLVNETDADAEFVLHVVAPAEPEAPIGSWDNPAELVMGENTVTFEEAGSNDYLYSFEAEASGILTINMTSDSWYYLINNLTSGVYGDPYASTDAEPVATQVINVAAGDVIQISVNAGASGWNDDGTEYLPSPAGTVTFTADFVIPEGAEGNPIFVQFEMDESYMYGNAFVTVPAYTTYYFQAYGIGGMQLTIEKALYDENGEYMDHERVDQYTLPGGNPRMPVTFAVTNDGDVDAEFALSIEWLAGSQMNPEYVGSEIDQTADVDIGLEAGDADGYYYTHIANVTGIVEFYLSKSINPESGEAVAADIIVTNMNTYEQKVMSYDGVNGIMSMNVNGGDELQIIVTAQPDENWEYPAVDISWGYTYIEGTEFNPARMDLGKNSVKIEANDEDGYYFYGRLDGYGYVTITMSGSNWEYQVGNMVPVFEDGKYVDSKLVWTDVQASNAKGAKSTTIYFESDNYFLRVNTANKKAGTVNFTVTYASHVIDLSAGKSTTLTFTDPATGKAIAASKANWEIIYVEDSGDVTLTNGKLTAATDIEDEIYVIAKASLKTDASVENYYTIYIRPVATSIQINKGHDYGEWVEEEENVTELTYVVNAYDNYPIELIAMVGPEAALQDVTWKSSNTKVLTIETESTWIDGVKMQYARLVPVHNSKNNTYGTGTVTLTATANDGSGVKATVKVNVVMETKEVGVYAKNHQWMVGPGKSVNMIAEAYTGYNQAPTNKDIKWSMAMVTNSYYDEESEEWIEELVEVPASVATLTEKGLLKTGKNLEEFYRIKVFATAINSDVSVVTGSYDVTLVPATKFVEISNVPATYDVNTGAEVYPEAFAVSGGGSRHNNVKWTVSDTKIAQIVTLEEPYIEYVYDDEGNEYQHTYWYQLVFTGKTGKVTLTATATDGSGKKATAVINVVKAPNEVRIDTSASVAAVGKTATLKATPGYYDFWTEEFTVASDKTVIWSFHEDDAELVAAVGAKLSNGKVTVNAKKFAAYIAENEQNWVDLRVVATAKLTNVDGEEVSAEAYVTFLPATTKVTMERFNKPVSGTVTIDDDDYVVLHAESAPETALDEYKWTTSNAKVATIEYNPDGSVTVRPVGKLGTAVIKATAMDGTNKSAQVTVKVVKKVDTLTIAEGVGVATTKSINLNKSLTINPTNASNKKVTWSWADEQSAADAKELKVTLNASGTLSAAKLKTISKPITLNVKVTAADGFGAVTTAPVTIYPATTKVELRPANSDLGFAKTVTINVNDTPELYITAVGTPEGLVLDQYKWTSSNAKIATVDQYGKVTFTGKVGSVNIRATAQDGTNKYAQVTFKLVKAVQEVSVSDDVFLSVAKSKTVTLSKSVVFNPADASSKNLTWTMELVQPAFDEEGYVTGYETKGDGIVPKTMATLNANTGALKCVNVADYEYVKVTFTAKDGFGASGSAIVVLAPSAVKGIELYKLEDVENENWVNYAKKTITTSDSYVLLAPFTTNDYEDKTASNLTFTVSNKNFEAGWDLDTGCVIVKPVEGAANPYGTVKVTMKTTDGGNVSSYITIKFVQPEPAT